MYDSSADRDDGCNSASKRLSECWWGRVVDYMGFVYEVDDGASNICHVDGRIDVGALHVHSMLCKCMCLWHVTCVEHGCFRCAN